MPRLLTLACMTLLPVAGCYTFTPHDPDLLRPGEEVRVRLVAPQDVRLIEYTVNGAVQVKGEAIGLDADTMSLSVFEVVSVSGHDHIGQGETLRVARGNVSALARKQFSFYRSALFAGGLLAGAFLVERTIAAISGSDGKPPGGGQPK
jgi:hypothetical protein